MCDRCRPKTRRHIDEMSTERASGPVKRRAMVESGALTCRTCGATPGLRGDQVSDQAVAFTCSRCLLGGPTEGAAIPIAAPVLGPDLAPQNQGVADRVSSTPALVSRRKPGRPSQWTSEQERKREWKRKHRGISPPGPVAP